MSPSGSAMDRGWCEPPSELHRQYQTDPFIIRCEGEGVMKVGVYL